MAIVARIDIKTCIQFPGMYLWILGDIALVSGEIVRAASPQFKTEVSLRCGCGKDDAVLRDHSDRF